MEEQPINLIAGEGDLFYRYKRQRISVKWERRRTLLENLKRVADELGRPPELLLKWLGATLGAQTTVIKDKYYLQGTWSSAAVEEVIQKFTRLCVICSLCGSPDTVLYAYKSVVRVSCSACGYDPPVRDKYLCRWVPTI